MSSHPVNCCCVSCEEERVRLGKAWRKVVHTSIAMVETNIGDGCTPNRYVVSATDNAGRVWVYREFGGHWEQLPELPQGERP